MIKKLFLLLVIANAALLVFIYAENSQKEAQANADRMKPLNAEWVKPLNAQQMARLGPSKVAQLNLACAEWGPIAESDRQRALNLLEPLRLGRTLLTQRVEVQADHWVYIPPKQSRAQAERSLAELRALGVNDSALINDGGQWNFAISLGVFRNREGAEARLQEVRNKGVKTALYQLRTQNVAMLALVLREPSQEIVAKLEALSGQLPGSTVTTGACPEIR